MSTELDQLRQERDALEIEANALADEVRREIRTGM
jgi:hypothetical protein